MFLYLRRDLVKSKVPVEKPSTSVDLIDDLLKSFEPAGESVDKSKTSEQEAKVEKSLYLAL